MIKRDEIEERAEEFDIHPANVERDYVFSWLLVGIYTISDLKNTLILKGGNCFRKCYFVNTRFSNDLDFSTPDRVDGAQLLSELNKVCDFVQENTAIIFEKERNKVEEKGIIDQDRKIYQAKLYFKDFYGNSDNITVSVRLDISEYDKIFLPIQTRYLIHPYSDADTCRVEIKCMKIEELLAIKLKCLLQRRHSNDLYDYIYSIFINKEIDVKRTEIVSTFLKRTIFEPSPDVVKGLLLALPFDFFRAVWNKYIICPKPSRIEFDFVLDNFKQSIEELFGVFKPGFRELAFFPANLRNPIIDAGRELFIIKLTYDGITREVEPYSLVYKRRKDGYGQEYFYGYDRTGGRFGGPGIKCFVNNKIQGIDITDKKYEPRFPVELSKAGEPGEKLYFTSSFSRRRTGLSSFRKKSFGSGNIYVLECSYCGKRFRRNAYNTRLNEHKDKYGNRCFGKIGYLVDTI